jgi:hypothetical protein
VFSVAAKNRRCRPDVWRRQAYSGCTLALGSGLLAQRSAHDATPRAVPAMSAFYHRGVTCQWRGDEGQHGRAGPRARGNRPFRSTAGLWRGANPATYVVSPNPTPITPTA